MENFTKNNTKCANETATLYQNMGCVCKTPKQ